MSRPLVVYKSSEAEKGSLGGREEGVRIPGCCVAGCIEGSGFVCGSLRRRITWVIVGWNMPPYFEWAIRCMGRVFP